MKNYSSKWIVQRITAILLIPLTFWFIYKCISFQKQNYFEIISFFNSYFNALFFLVLMITMLIHAKIGCETIIEDYISSNFSKACIRCLIIVLSYSAILISSISVYKIVF